MRRPILAPTTISVLQSQIKRLLVITALNLKPQTMITNHETKYSGRIQFMVTNYPWKAMQPLNILSPVTLRRIHLNYMLYLAVMVRMKDITSFTRILNTYNTTITEIVQHIRKLSKGLYKLATGCALCTSHILRNQIIILLSKRLL